MANDNDVERYLKVSERLFSRYDKNGDKALTESEWSTMLIDPRAADTNRDESISVEEYAKFMMSRQRTRPSFSDAIRPQQRE